MSFFTSTEWGSEGSPFKPGDWVSNASQVAMVKDVYLAQGEIVLDLVLYSRSGDKIGRESPACGGPRSFEPCCPSSGWFRIKKPDFPMRMVWQEADDDPTKVVASWYVKKLPSGKFFPRKKSAARRVVVSDFDPELEAASRRMAAQQLRDIAKTAGNMAPVLIERAKMLEDEAKTF